MLKPDMFRLSDSIFISFQHVTRIIYHKIQAHLHVAAMVAEIGAQKYQL